jgi:tetratricopeptide (TPR) repeat protein
MNPGVFRKRTTDPHPDHSPWSSRLRQLGVLAASEDVAGLLAAVNQELSFQTDPIRQSQLLSLVGDSQMYSGNFDAALSSYNRAADLARNDPRNWFRPVIGAIASLLKNVQVANAQAGADAAITKAAANEQQHAIQLAQLDAQAQAGIVVVVRPRPLRLSVVATRLGKLFFDEGELAVAKTYFQQALTASPQGASRARLGQAEIAMREGRLQDAKDSALSALQVGKFHAKTIAAISIFLRASDQLGDQTIDQRLVDGLAQAKPKVRDRATLSIVGALRAQNNPLWINFANTWLGANALRNAVIAAEFNKLFQATQRVRNDSPSQQLAASTTLLATAGLSPTEFVSAAKEYVRSSLSLGQVVDLIGLANQAAAGYGVGWRNRTLHSLALSCMMARRHDMARPLLQSIVTQNLRDSHWGKAVWALGRMEKILGNYQAAANLYQLFATEPSMPIRYRLQGRIKWAQSAIATGDSASIPLIRASLVDLANQVQDFDLLLDFARQLTHAPAEFHELADELFSRGEALAKSQFVAAQNPSVAIGILFRLTRRQVCDFAQYEDAVDAWNNLTQQQRDWLWSPKTEFWQYVASVLVAMTRLAQDNDAGQLANQFLNDAATPVEGKLQILPVIARNKLYAGQLDEAFSDFALMISLAPMNRLCAEAYYWLSLKAKINGNEANCVNYAEKIQRVLGQRVGLLTEWELDCKASLLRSGLITGTPLQSSNYDEDFQTTCLAHINDDLARF